VDWGGGGTCGRYLGEGGGGSLVGGWGGGGGAPVHEI
jgi:hypothetical protein